MAGLLSHSVIATTGTSSYTASFNTAYLLTTAANPAAGGAVTPASGSYYPAGTVVSLAATPAAGYSFTNWTGAVANNTSASTSVTMTAAQTVTANFAVAVSPTTVSLTPGSLTFNATAGTASAAQTVQLTNTGTAVLTIASVMLTGANVALFTQTNTCGGSVAAGATCTLSVIFTPSAAGSFAAAIAITDNAGASPQTIALSGTALAAPSFSLSASPATIAVQPAGVAGYLITASPHGGAFTNLVTLTVAGLPEGAVATFQPASITPGASGANSTLTVQTAPRSALLRSSGAPVTAFAMLGFVLLVGRRRRWVTGCLLALATLAAMGTLSGCSGKSGAGTYTLTITGTSGSGATPAIQTTTVTLIVE